MTVTQIVSLLKLKLGIVSSVQDERLEHLIEAIVDELENEKGIQLDFESARHTSFIVDYAEFRYKYVTAETPRYLMHRLYNLFLKDRP